MSTNQYINDFIFGDSLVRDFEPQEDLIFGGLGYQKPKVKPIPIGRKIEAQEEEFEDAEEEEWEDD